MLGIVEPPYDDSKTILIFQVIYDTTDLWLEAGIDTIICKWEPKISGYLIQAKGFWDDDPDDSLYIYAYPPDSVLVCDTIWREE